MNDELLKFAELFRAAVDMIDLSEEAVLEDEPVSDPEAETGDFMTDTDEDVFALSAADLLTLDAGVIENAQKITETLRDLGSSTLDIEQKQRLIDKWKADVEAAKAKARGAL